MQFDIYFKKSFKKEFRKHSKIVQDRFWERLALLQTDFYSVQLNVHALKGEYKDFLSMNVTGDFRAIFELVDQKAIYFYRINTHSQLYR